MKNRLNFISEKKYRDLLFEMMERFPSGNLSGMIYSAFEKGDLPSEDDLLQELNNIINRRDNVSVYKVYDDKDPKDDAIRFERKLTGLILEKSVWLR